jgi:prepilin-type N-terminal cleavage/methylation domain-containing protein
MSPRRESPRHSRRYDSRRAGFTLLEVLVALLVAGISLGAVFQAFSQSKRISWKADEKLESARIAQNILADSALIDAALRDEGKEGIVEGENGWKYIISVKPLEYIPENEENPLEIPAMLDLRLCLVHDSGQKEKSFCLNRWYRR